MIESETMQKNDLIAAPFRRLHICIYRTVKWKTSLVNLYENDWKTGFYTFKSFIELKNDLIGCTTSTTQKKLEISITSNYIRQENLFFLPMV